MGRNAAKMPLEVHTSAFLKRESKEKTLPRSEAEQIVVSVPSPLFADASVDRSRNCAEAENFRRAVVMTPGATTFSRED